MKQLKGDGRILIELKEVNESVSLGGIVIHSTVAKHDLHDGVVLASNCSSILPGDVVSIPKYAGIRFMQGDKSQAVIKESDVLFIEYANR